jgi:hypothetical protein
MELLISVVRTGGVAGMRTRWAVHLEREDEIDSWRPLIDACPWEESDDSGAPDRYLYLITVNDRSAKVPEGRLRGPWRDLTDRVQHAAGQQSNRTPPSASEGDPEEPPAV